MLQELDGKSIGNNRTLKVSDAIPRPFEKNNKVALPGNASSDSNATTNSDDEDSSALPNDSVSKARSARDAVTPLAHMSYSDQLEHKKNSLAQTLKRLVNKLYTVTYSLCF